jgi:hypothetical protein
MKIYLLPAVDFEFIENPWLGFAGNVGSELTALDQSRHTLELASLASPISSAAKIEQTHSFLPDKPEHSLELPFQEEKEKELSAR